MLRGPGVEHVTRHLVEEVQGLVSAVEGAPVDRLQDLRLGHPSFIGAPGHGLALWRLLRPAPPAMVHILLIGKSSVHSQQADGEAVFTQLDEDFTC